MMKYFFLLSSIVINILGQFFLKYGVNNFVEKNSNIHFPQIFFSKFVIFGFFFYGISAIFWIKAIEKINLNIAYPTLAFGYVIVYFLSSIFLNETIHAKGIIGIILISIGIVIMHLKLQ